VFGDTNESALFNPVLEALKEQAERIESLEEQNRDLIRQETLLISLMEITAKTGELMSRSIKALERLESSLDKEDPREEDSE
jgi:hypothetical protein